MSNTTNVKYPMSNRIFHYLTFGIRHLTLDIKNSFSSQSGVGQLAVVMLLLLGVAVTTYVVQNRTNLIPHAAEENPREIVRAPGVPGSLVKEEDLEQINSSAPEKDVDGKTVAKIKSRKQSFGTGGYVIEFIWSDGRKSYDSKDNNGELIRSKSYAIRDGVKSTAIQPPKFEGNTVIVEWTDGTIEYNVFSGPNGTGTYQIYDTYSTCCKGKEAAKPPTDKPSEPKTPADPTTSCTEHIFFCEGGFAVEKKPNGKKEDGSCNYQFTKSAEQDPRCLMADPAEPSKQIPRPDGTVIDDKTPAQPATNTCDYKETCTTADGKAGVHSCKGSGPANACKYDPAVNPDCSVCQVEGATPVSDLTEATRVKKEYVDEFKKVENEFIADIKNRVPASLQNDADMQTALSKASQALADSQVELSKCADGDRSCLERARAVFDLGKTAARLANYKLVVANVREACVKIDFGIDPPISAATKDDPSKSERVSLCNGENGTDKKWRWFVTPTDAKEFADNSQISGQFLSHLQDAEKAVYGVIKTTSLPSSLPTSINSSSSASSSSTSTNRRTEVTMSFLSSGPYACTPGSAGNTKCKNALTGSRFKNVSCSATSETCTGIITCPQVCNSGYMCSFDPSNLTASCKPDNSSTVKP